MSVKKEINYKYIAKVSLSNSLNTLGTNNLVVENYKYGEQIKNIPIAV